MTPPENAGGGRPTHRPETENAGERDVTATNGAGAPSPPWQQVARDGWSDPRDSSEMMAHTGDLPVVSGVAAQGMFGNPAPGAAPAEHYPAKGQENVASASLGTRGRSAPSALRRPGRGPRRASLMVKRIDPWSVLKLSLVLGVAMFLVWMVAVGLLYIVLDGMGVWDKVNGTYTSLTSGTDTAAAAEPLISAGRVFGVAAIVGMINIVLLSALATVSAFIYNVSADLAGGLEITLSERE